MIEQPTISVLMPSYNSAKYLAEAMDSILNQTFGDFEFIIINDGSTDDSESLLRAYEKKDHRIRLISRGNTGIVRALNEGLELAQGQYIARMDSDDIALPERFAKQVKYMEEHPECVVVGAWGLMIDPEGCPVRLHRHPITHEAIDSAHMNGDFGAVPHSCALIRRDVLQRINGYRKAAEPAEDVDLFLRLAEEGKLANLPECLFKYRLHPTSTGYAKRKKQIQAAFFALEEAHRRRELDIPQIPEVHDVKVYESLQEIHCMWTWWALSDGNVSTARKHALIALKTKPTSRTAWKALVHAIKATKVEPLTTGPA
jgi:GT2 family glycosyltransferase